jgi:hypothetical protein
MTSHGHNAIPQQNGSWVEDQRLSPQTATDRRDDFVALLHEMAVNWLPMMLACASAPAGVCHPLPDRPAWRWCRCRTASDPRPPGQSTKLRLSAVIVIEGEQLDMVDNAVMFAADPARSRPSDCPGVVRELWIWSGITANG